MNDERVRLFVALELPPEARGALARWRADALAGTSELGLIAPEYLHVTLCFLGWQSADSVQEITAACGSFAVQPPQLGLGQSLWLPPRRPRVLAVRLHDDDGRTAALQSDLSRRLAAGGWYEPERRAYLPHVTVARVRRHSSLRPTSLPSPPPLRFSAPRITLYRSRLSPAGARYEALACVRLG
jgi:2'-5' RNA ligase